jgi:hypothetical protein
MSDTTESPFEKERRLAATARMYGDVSGCWSCVKCRFRFPENYVPVRCPDCDGPLIRPGDERWPMHGVAVAFLAGDAEGDVA